MILIKIELMINCLNILKELASLVAWVCRKRELRSRFSHNPCSLSWLAPSIINRRSGLFSIKCLKLVINIFSRIKILSASP